MLVVGFIFGGVLASARVSVCAPRRGGWCVRVCVVGRAVGAGGGGRAEHVREPRVPWSRGGPSEGKGRGQCSLLFRGGGWSPLCVHHCSFSLTWCLGFFVLFLLGGRSERVNPVPAPQPDGSMKPSALSPAPSLCPPLSSPCLPSPPFLPAPLRTCELCIQAAATFQCVTCHGLAHPRPDDQAR